MAEYIIKQKVTDRMGCCLANVKAEYKAAKDEFTKVRFGDYISAIQAMIDVVGCVEEADVQPVKHGKWLKASNTSWNNYKCSLCDTQYAGMGAITFTYCPNCGAKMIKDGEQNDT